MSAVEPGAMGILSPALTDELIEILTGPTPIRIVGAGTHSAFRLPHPEGTLTVSTRKMTGIVDFQPDDQMVVVRGGTTLADLQTALAERGQCLPYFPVVPAERGASIGGLVSMNLPHALEGRCGSWRDWVLGMTVVLADGTIARAGSRVVKNVAGYDVHKLMIGARGTLAFLTKVTLRTYPLRSLPPSAARSANEQLDSEVNWIQRTLPSDFAAATVAAQMSPGFDDPTTSTLWRDVSPSDALPRYPGDWLFRAGCGAANLEFTEPQARLMARAKSIFDPESKFNPGEMGIF